MTKFKGPGNPWREKVEKLRLDCWWEGADLGSWRYIFEGYENNRDSKDVPKEDRKDRKFLNAWWNHLKLGNRRKGEGKRFIYWWIMDPLPPEQKDPILKDTEECLNEKLALLKKA